MKHLLIALSILAVVGSAVAQEIPSTQNVYSVSLNEHLQPGNNNIGIRNLLGLSGPVFSGREVIAVTVVAQTRAGRGTADVMVNGIPQGPRQVVATTLGSYTFYINPNMNAIDSTLSTLGLNTQGNFFISSISVTLKPDLVSTPLLQETHGLFAMPVLPMLGIGQESLGRGIEYVVLTAQTALGRGTATLVVDGIPVAEYIVGQVPADYVFTLPLGKQVLGLENHTLTLQLQGRFAVRGLGVKFLRK